MISQAIVLLAGIVNLLTVSLMDVSYQKVGFSQFKRSLNNTSFGYALTSRPHPVRRGKSSERFEVRPGNCSAHKNWNDCTTDRERSELSQKKPYSKPNIVYWYAWSIYAPRNFVNVYPTKVALGQFHQKGSRSPAVMFQNHTGGYWLNRPRSGSKANYCQLIDKGSFKGRWHDIVVQAKWSHASNGFIRVWVNGILKCRYDGPLLKKHNRPVYFKYGVYRSFLSRYKLRFGANKIPTQVIYFDEVKMNLSRTDVDIRFRP